MQSPHSVIRLSPSWKQAIHTLILGIFPSTGEPLPTYYNPASF